MKKILLILVVIMIGCTDQSSLKEPSAAQSDSISHKIELQDAIEIVNGFNETGSRSSQYDLSYITYTGNHNNIDTLAYVFNYENENGFVIVSTDDRVSSPILGFSDIGHFSYEGSPDDIIYSNFVSSLASYENYVRHTGGKFDKPYATTQDGQIKGAIVQPSLVKSMGQHNPYDKYVKEVYPDCPVGCVAVATCQVMLHCKDLLNYHGISYDFEGMREAISDSITSEIIPQADGLVIKEFITYDKAIDRVAKIMFNIGADVNMMYSIIGSGAKSSDAIMLLQNLEYTFMTNGLEDFNKIDMFKDLFDDKCIIYVRGKVSKYGGHAWIIDGGRCSGDPSEMDEDTLVYFHCDWGWDGKSNGSFNADIFLSQDAYPYIYSYASIQLAPSMIEQ